MKKGTGSTTQSVPSYLGGFSPIPSPLTPIPSLLTSHIGLTLLTHSTGLPASSTRSSCFKPAWKSILRNTMP